MKAKVTNAEQVTEAITAEFREAAKKSMTDAAKKAEELLTKKAKEVIEEFYNEYDPVSYDRTWNFRFKSYKSVYAKNGNGAYGGVKFDHSFMHTYERGTGLSTEQIFDAVFLDGSHGAIYDGSLKRVFDKDGKWLRTVTRKKRIKDKNTLSGLWLDKTFPSPQSKMQKYFDGAEFIGEITEAISLPLKKFMK